MLIILLTPMAVIYLFTTPFAPGCFDAHFENCWTGVKPRDYSRYILKRKCADIQSEDENTPPNTQRDDTSYTWITNVKLTAVERDSSTDTATRRAAREVTKPATLDEPTATAASAPPPTRSLRSPTTPSPILLETPPACPPRHRPRAQLRERHQSRHDRRAAAEPYQRQRGHRQQPISPTVNPVGLKRTSPTTDPRSRPRVASPQSRFLSAQWSIIVWLICVRCTTLPGSPSPRYSTSGDLSELADAVGCRYGGKCSNGLTESTKLRLARNAHSRELSVVAADDIEAGEVLGQYLGELEHVSVSRTNRPRNEGYRFVKTQWLERPSHLFATCTEDRFAPNGRPALHTKLCVCVARAVWARIR
ncbi:hypothetical protein GQ600_18843 [Phytophthora cactorum]|nr:hypothetical protein GQ600_18843 [Phytophthora cactorum]